MTVRTATTVFLFSEPSGTKSPRTLLGRLGDDLQRHEG